ncbi:MAG: TetR/AcrR family transcriptional regulator [Myxococcota bacterium]|nr:TetR/AcrR family transcriptional regulator [Myxococcota bacterium]
MTLSGATNLDGRQRRTARSRLAICEACLDLVESGALQPTADEIAKRAGVSRRSIFNHFADLAELYDAVVDVGMQRYAPLRQEIPENGSAEQRVEELVRTRSKFLEATTPFIRGLTVQTFSGAASDQAERVSIGLLQIQHDEIARLFQRDLASLPTRERNEALEAISVAMAPLTWEYLRRGRGHSIARARAVMKRGVTAVLRDAGVEA